MSDAPCIRQFSSQHRKQESTSELGTYQIQDFPGSDEIVQAVHHFFDRGTPVPPVHVEDVDVRRAQLHQASLDAEVHAFEIIASEVSFDLDIVVTALKIRGKLSVDNVARTFRRK